MSPGPPSWVKDAVFYQIFPDRFALSERVQKPSNLEPWNSPPTRYGFKGGDLLGVAEHLDYLERLGVTGIYFNPIFQSASNHRYHTHDYYRVDPILGGNKAFREFLDQAHARSIRVVLDGVFNHASRGFFQFQQTVENGIDSPYLDWFHFARERLERERQLDVYPGETRQASFARHPGAFDELGYRCWFQLPALPKFNTSSKSVRQFLFDVARYWIEYGIDGWRLDVPSEIDDDTFWQEFRRVVKDANPEAYLVGEVWDDATHWLQGDQFDGAMNYILHRACLGFFGGDELDVGQRPGGYELRRLTASQFADAIDDLLSLYPWSATMAQLNLLSSHDMPRFSTLVGGRTQALKLATLFLMCFPGAPSVYYGDEIGMEGGSDPDCRRSFTWQEAAWDQDLLSCFRRAISLRKGHPALRRGEFLTVFADDAHRVYAFARRLSNSRAKGTPIVVILNAGSRGYECDLPALDLFANGTELHDLWGSLRAHVRHQRIYGGSLAPGTAAVLTT